MRGVRYFRDREGWDEYNLARGIYLAMGSPCETMESKNVPLKDVVGFRMWSQEYHLLPLMGDRIGGEHRQFLKVLLDEHQSLAVVDASMYDVQNSRQSVCICSKTM